MPDQEKSQDGPPPHEAEQTVFMERLVELSIERTRLSADRSEMSAERSYMNAERTLSVWIRTALALMVVGIAVDRFGLLLLQDRVVHARSDTASQWVGAGLVAFGVLVVLLTGARFRRYAVDYRRAHEPPHHHGPLLAPTFALMAAAFGIVILVLLLISP